jgi:hypothetical protein
MEEESTFECVFPDIKASWGNLERDGNESWHKVYKPCPRLTIIVTVFTELKVTKL